MKDRELVSRFESGDVSVVEDIYRLYRGPFIEWASKRYTLLDTAFFKDIFQEVILVLYRKICRTPFKGFIYTMKTYVFSIGKILIINELKKNNLLKWNENEASLKMEENMELQEEYINRIENLLKEIDSDCRELIWQFFYEDKSINEITQSLNLRDHKHTSQKKWRCIEKLKRYFFDHKNQLTYDTEFPRTGEEI